MISLWPWLLRATRGGFWQRYVYHAYLSSRTWQRRSRAVLRRAHGRCAACGGRAEHAHHVTYKRVGAERDGDVVALCEECHRKKHRGRRGAKRR